MNTNRTIVAGMVNGGGYEKRFKSVRKAVLSIGISPTLLASSGKNEDIVKVVMDESDSCRGHRLEELEKRI